MSIFRRIVVTLSVAVLVWGCGGSEGEPIKADQSQERLKPSSESEGSLRTISFVSSTACPATACVVGTMGCDTDGDQVPCIQDPAEEEGCGMYDYRNAQGCGVETFCYRGECLSPDNIPIPTTSSDPDWQSLFNYSSATYPIDDSVQVIPYEAFINALRESPFTAASNAQTNIAAKVVYDGNDNNILGATAELEEVDEFSGDVFIVALDPVRAMNGSTTLELRSYFVVAAPGLSGPTSWVGGSASLLAMGALGIPSESCCSGQQPQLSCGFGWPGTGGLDGPDIGGGNPCPSGVLDCPFNWAADLAEHIYTDPRVMPFRTGGGSFAEPDETGRTHTRVLRGNGQPAVYMYAMQDRGVHEGLYDQATASSVEMVAAPPLFCDICNVALCPSDPPDSFAGSPVNATDACGLPVAGRDVPEHCQQMMPQGVGGLDCAGLFDNMGREFDPTDVCSNLMSTAGTSIISGTGGNPGTSPCNGRVTPNWCTMSYQEGGDCDCDAQCSQDRQQFMSWFYGCSGAAAGNAPGQGVTCNDDGTVCVDSDGSGREVCYGCNDDGACRSFVKSSFVDSRYASTSKGNTEKATHTQCPAGFALIVGTSSNWCMSVTTGQVADATAPSSQGTGSSTAKGEQQPQQPSGGSEDTEGKETADVEEDNDTTFDNKTVVGKGEKNNKGVDSVQPAIANHDPQDFAKPETPFNSNDGSGRRLDSRGVGERKGGKPDRSSGSRGSNKTTAEGDPVLLSSGALVVAHKDLSFSGAVRPLEFERYYDSTSADRSILGSNWTHNYDSRVIPVRPGNMPDWAPRYCIAYAPTTTCAFVQYPGGGKKLFIKSPGDPNHLFYPQAGSSDTLRMDESSWQLHSPDGRMRLFDSYGYLISDRDRFGNGYSVEYETTPVYALLMRYCNKTSVYVKRAPIPSDGTSQAQTDSQFDPRVCRALAAMYGDQTEPVVSVKGWNPYIENGSDYAPLLKLPGDGPNIKVGPGERFHETFPFDVDARAYAQSLLGAYPNPADSNGERAVKVEVNNKLPTGDRKLRPKIVRDDSGRTLNFEYYDDPSDKVTYGLLKKVTGPSSITSVSYDYERPAKYPERLQESFLTRVDRLDGSPGVGLVQQQARSFDFVYNWPSSSGFDSYYDHTTEVFENYFNYFSTFNGCNWGEGLAAIVCRPGNVSGGGSNLIKPATVCGAGPDGQGEYYGGAATAYDGFVETATCSTGNNGKTEESPCYLATRSQEDYISSVADNLVLLSRNDVVEVASRYEVNPNTASFDRVTVQRYGGLNNSEYGPYQQASRTSYPGWGSVDYPEFSFEYVSAMPTNTASTTPGDATESSSLPSSLLSRYPLEDPQTDWKILDPCLESTEPGACGGVPEGDSYTSRHCEDGYAWPPHRTALCDPNEAMRRTLELPGIFQTYDYYPLGNQPNDDPSHPHIYRSRLTCRQLASAHLGDATHNGLLKERNDVTGDWVLLEGSRSQIQDDSRRVCAWSSVTDRDGHKRHVGLNFRGQPLVEALEVEGELLVTEKLYNADGLVLEERGTTLSTDSWSETDGWTSYAYQEIEPDGAQGWNEWLPFWWMRRMNMTSVRDYPRSNAGQESFVHEWDPDGDTFEGSRLEWVETSLSYEPLFNQIKEIETRSKSLGTSARVLQRVSYDFDYQEFSRDQWQPFYDALQETQAWGWRIPIDFRDGGNLEQWLFEWHFPMHFYGEDLNGDSLIGFADFGPVDSMKIRAFPVRMIVENPEADTSAPDWQQRRITHISPSPHGLPARIEGPSGDIVVFEYYPASQYTFGNHPLIEDPYASPHNKGFLARVLKRRFNRDYSDNEAGAFDAPVNDQVCAELAGPYQWILPEGCGGGASVGLANLGIPLEVRDELLLAAAQATDPDARPWSITAFNYTVAGGVYEILQEGLRTAVVRDTDGRVRQVTNAQGAQTTVMRDKEGDATRIEVYEDLMGENGTLVSRVHFQYDAEGNVLTRCEDVVDGGCETSLDFSDLLSYDAARETVAPTYLLTTYRYTPEGKLYKSKDASGVETVWTYDERGLVVAQETQGGANPVGDVDEARRVRYIYDMYGQVTDIEYGTSYTRSSYGTYDQSYSYDGIGRVRSMTDGNGAEWQFAWAPRGGLAAYKQDDVPYGSMSGADTATAAHEVFTAYDGFGRPVQTRWHDTVLQALDYDLYGFVRHQETRPVGTSPGSGQNRWMTYDAMGNLVWSVDEQGNQSISVVNPKDRITASVMVRVDSESVASTPSYLTTSNRTSYDLGWHPAIVEVLGHNGELEQHEYVYNSAGDLLAYHNPENEISNFTNNLLGWPERVVEPSSVGLLASVQAVYTYNARGQVLELNEPGEPGGVTSYAYNNFGERVRRTLPMDPMRPFDTLAYDGYGRLSTAKLHKSAVVGDHDELSWAYIKNGNNTSEVQMHWTNSPTTSSLMRSANYDALGQLFEASEYNLALADALGTSAIRRVSHEYQHDKLGRVTDQTQKIYENATLLSTKVTAARYTLDAQSRWKRALEYPSGTTWAYEQDTLGRLGRMVQTKVSGASANETIDFHWVGGLYKGRAQTYDTAVGAPDPLREVRAFDGMGRRTNISYGAVDLDGSSAPVNTAWGNTYCLGSWNSSCAAPLLDIALKHDVMGRLVSSRKTYGHVLDDGMGAPLPMSAHRKRWRGYNYSARGFLENEWISDSVTDVEHDSLVNHQATTADIEQVGNGPGEKWNWVRESGAGDLIAIEQAGNPSNKRWQHTNASATTTGARDPGHLLDTVAVDGASLAISHDGRGRVTNDGNFEYVYDPFNRLVAAYPSGTSSFSESYTYDAHGRLIEVYDHAETERREQIYDGPQMIASYLDGALDWEATWGPGLDHLLQWRHISAAGGERTYIPLRDHRNNVVGLWDTDAAALTGLADFSAQGRMTLFNDDETVSCQEEGSGFVCGQLSGAFPFGFNSAWRSRTTGLVSMRHRWYSPTLGQFVSHDPLEYTDSKNMYAFAALDPVNGWDPWGLKNREFGKKEIQKSGAAVPALVGAREGAKWGARIGVTRGTVGVVVGAGIGAILGIGVRIGLDYLSKHDERKIEIESMGPPVSSGADDNPSDKIKPEPPPVPLPVPTDMPPVTDEDDRNNPFIVYRAPHNPAGDVPGDKNLTPGEHLLGEQLIGLTTMFPRSVPPHELPTDERLLDGSPYLSVTRNRRIAEEFAKRRAGVVQVIDLRKIPGDMIAADFSTPGGRSIAIINEGIMRPNRSDDLARVINGNISVATKDQEILIRGPIPQHAIIAVETVK